MKKKLFNILAIVYTILAIIITLCLLSYTEFDVAKYKNFTLIPVNKKVNDVNKGTLLIVKNDNNVKVDDEIYYFNNLKRFEYGKVTQTIEDSLTVNGEIISYDNVLGNTKDSTKIYFLGFIYNILTSKLGYLLIVIFPVLFLFLYEIYLFSTYLRAIKDKKGDKNEKKKK